MPSSQELGICLAMAPEPWPSPELRAVQRVAKNASMAAQEILTMATRVVHHVHRAHAQDPRVKTHLAELNEAIASCLEGIILLRRSSLRGLGQGTPREVLEHGAATLRHGARIVDLLGKLEDSPLGVREAAMQNLLGPRAVHDH